MELERNLKVRKLREKQQIHERISEPEINLMDLPTEVLDIMASFLNRKHMKNFGLTNKKCQQTFQQIYYKNFDLTNCLKVDEKKMLKVIKNINYISLNLNKCHWLSSETILKLVSKKSVRELNLIDCACTPEVIDAIDKLSLTSLAFSLTKHWFDFFVSNELNLIPRFKKVKKLKILHSNCKSNGFLVNHVTRYVLRHCPNLVYLKLVTYPDQNSNFSDRFLPNEIFQAQNIPTPVPKLETLILDLHFEGDFFQSVSNLVKLILNQKENPIKRIYLGKQTAKAISSGILCSNIISFETTKTLCLSSFYDEDSRSGPKITDFLNVPGFESAMDSMLKARSCNRIEMENLSLRNFKLITQKIFKSGNTSIEEISLRGSFINNSQFFGKSLFKIANFCPQINILDLSSIRWNVYTNNNSKLMECLSNFTNLRTLYLTPDMLFSATKVEKFTLKSSFRKLADNCKFIEKFRIVNIIDEGVIDQDVLSHVKYFENLQELHLVNFVTTGTEHALPKIAQSCARLTHLYIKNIFNLKLSTYKLPWKQIFIHTKQLKHLSVMPDFLGDSLTKDFVDGLVECAQLEKLCVTPIYDDVDKVSQYFAENIGKLTKLEVFVTEGLGKVIANFQSAINKIEETKRPEFYWYICHLNRTVLPLAHRHLLQYNYYE